MKRYLLSACLLLLLGACAGLPETIKNVPVTDISYRQASQNLNKYEGTSVRWGGVIVDVENQENSTLLQILSYPLDYTGRPDLREKSQGRFVIKSAKFLDPAVYEKDEQVTVAGTIKGDIERMVDEKTLRVPLISSEAIHLWEDPGYGGYYGSPYYRGGFYRPWGGYY